MKWGDKHESAIKTFLNILHHEISEPIFKLHDQEEETIEKKPIFSGILEEYQSEYGLLEKGELSIPNDMQMLKSPNVWIGDMGASGHCTARQNNVPKEIKGEKACKPNGRWYHDSS